MEKVVGKPLKHVPKRPVVFCLGQSLHSRGLDEIPREAASFAGLVVVEAPGQAMG